RKPPPPRASRWLGGPRLGPICAHRARSRQRSLPAVARPPLAARRDEIVVPHEWQRIHPRFRGGPENDVEKLVHGFPLSLDVNQSLQNKRRAPHRSPPSLTNDKRPRDD